MKRNGFTYIETLLSSVLVAIVFTGILNTTSFIRQSISKAEQLTLLSAYNLNMLDEINAELQENGELIETNRKINTDGIISTIKIQKDENSRLYLVKINSQTNNVSLTQTAVLAVQMEVDNEET